MAGAAAQPSDGLAGRPGTYWRNHTDLVWWQWICAMRNPCARCLKRDGRIFAGPEPPVKLHPNCECSFLPVMPGALAAMAFEPVPEKVSALPAGDQRKIVGAECAALVAAGLATWYDLFDSNGNPLVFGDVVKRKHLSIDQLIAAGIAEEIARRAVQSE